MINPFSTKFWVSGVIPFQFSEPGESIDALLEKAQQNPTCQIVGPHGSGKTTLLFSLLKRYEERGEKVRCLLFNSQHRQIPEDVTFRENMTFFVDGFEQLRFRDQYRLLCVSERLILTRHRPIWFVPILYRTQPRFSIFLRIVHQMIPNLPEESVLQAVYERSGGNFRNALFELYDQWEERDKQ